MLRLSTALFVAMLGLVVSPVRAPAQGISAQDLSILQQALPPEERARLLEAVKSRAAAPTAPTSPAAAETPAAPLPAETATPVLPTPLEMPEIPRAKGGDTIVVKARFKDEVQHEEAAKLLTDANFARLIGQSAYKLDRQGIVQLPGVAEVPLAGLTAEEMAIRLSAERRLASLLIEVSLLPLEPVGAQALQPFGYALFAETESDVFELEPAAYAPVPRDYVIGPGDQLKVQLYGTENYEVTLVVNQDGTINFPKVGPRPVAGLTFGELKEEIETRVSNQLVGTRAAVTLAEIRSIRVFVVGEVNKPGAYTVSGLSRISNVLFRGGGITTTGSLRQIQLKRKGQAAHRLDLYELLLKGDTDNDAQLQSGDVVLVPPIGATVGVDGEVKRPAIYELRGETTVAEVLELAGGLLPAADRRAIQLERVDGDGRRKVRRLDLTAGAGTLATMAGDVIRVQPVPEELDGAVYLSGHVTRPGAYEWKPGMTVTDILPSDLALKPKADMGYVMIRRSRGPDRLAEVYSADLGAALQAPKSASDVALQPRDRVTVFEVGISRGGAIQEVIDDLTAQASSDWPLQVVRIAGQVRAPGAYPLEPGMRISDLLRAGGGLTGAAYAVDAELARYSIGPGGARQTEVIPVDLAAARSGNEQADLALSAHDYLNIKEVPEWEAELEIEIRGEVRFPGVYQARRGETLASLLERAGGLTDLAFAEGSIFTRETLRQREKQQLEVLATRLQSDLARLALSATAASAVQATRGGGQAGGAGEQALAVGQSLLEQLRQVEPVGRLVIDLPKILAAKGDPRYDIMVRNGDKLLVPPRTQEVMVLGEVQYATSHLYAPSLGRDDYIRRSGGLSVNADKNRVYVVRANGAVMAETKSGWFRRGRDEIRPGDTVIAPLDTERLPPITQWASITQIIYNLAVAVAAVNSF
jgi:protein involved in polysaccharide export with SLBB domain